MTDKVQTSPQFYVQFEDLVPIDHFKYVFKDGGYIKLDTIGDVPIVWNSYIQEYQEFEDYPSALRYFADLLENIN